MQDEDQFLSETNARHDRELERLGIDWRDSRLRSGWKSTAPRGKLLTDKKIAQYQARGWYGQDFKDARAKLAHSRTLKANLNRTQNFFERNGRSIYNPV